MRVDHNMNRNHTSFERLFIDKKSQLRLSSIKFLNKRGIHYKALVINTQTVCFRFWQTLFMCIHLGSTAEMKASYHHPWRTKKCL